MKLSQSQEGEGPSQMAVGGWGRGGQGAMWVTWDLRCLGTITQRLEVGSSGAAKAFLVDFSEFQELRLPLEDWPLPLVYSHLLLGMNQPLRNLSPILEPLL